LLAPGVSALETSAIPVRLIIPDQTAIKLQLAETVSLLTPTQETAWTLSLRKM